MQDALKVTWHTVQRVEISCVQRLNINTSSLSLMAEALAALPIMGNLAAGRC